MNTIYAVSNGAGRNISSYTFYAKKELAVSALNEIKKDRKNKPGVTVIVDNEDTFSFIIGWEENEVTFHIIPIEVIDNS